MLTKSDQGIINKYLGIKNVSSILNKSFLLHYMEFTYDLVDFRDPYLKNLTGNISTFGSNCLQELCVIK